MKRYLFYINQLYAFSVVRPLQKAIIQQGDEVAWFLDNSTELLKYIKPNEKLLKTVEEVKAYNPIAVFVPGNIVPDFFPGIKVEIFHGFNSHKRKDNKGHFRIRGFFDLYCTQGPDTTIPFKQLEKKCGYFAVEETGWPKMDPLFDGELSSPKRNNPPIILFTSTFTPRLSAAPILFDTIRQLAETGKWKWIVNFHPKMDRKIVTKYKSMKTNNLSVIETDDVIPLLKQADVMVSDTSSVLAEFLLLHKPVVTFKNRIPGSHLINILEPEKLEEAINNALSPKQELLNAIKSYCDAIHPYRDGGSSMRVLQAVNIYIQKAHSYPLKKRKPLNLIRKIKIRMHLKYWF